MFDETRIDEKKKNKTTNRIVSKKFKKLSYHLAPQCIKTQIQFLPPPRVCKII